jgi:hypothetical protein
VDVGAILVTAADGDSPEAVCVSTFGLDDSRWLPTESA